MRGTRGRRRVAGLATVAGLLTLLVPLIAPAGADPGPAPPSKQRRILNDAHTDVLDVRYVDGALVARTRLDESVEAPSDVLFQLRDNDFSRLSIPDNPEFAFLGPAGTPVWVAPQVQDPTLLFAGWDTLSLLPGTLAGDAVDISLASVTGPGTLEVFQTDDFGSPVRVFSSRDPAWRTLRQPVAGHVHANWAFSALGRYELTFEVTGADLSGRPLTTGPVIYTWYVGGTEAGDVPALASSTTLAVSPPDARVGQEVTLTGTVDPNGAPGWLEFLDGDAVLGHSAVSAARATLSTSGLSAGVHQLSARFVPANTTDHQRSSSPPVSYQVSGTGTTSSSTSSSTATSTTATTTGTTRVVPTAGSTTTTTTSCAAPAAEPVVVRGDGHVDYAARILGGGLASQIKDGTVAGTTTWREPARVGLHVVPAAATTVPGSGFGFLGSPGDRVWQIPQTQRSGILWLGWNTEEISAAQVRGGITWSLDRVEGPGSVAVYLLNTFGAPQIVFNSGDGVPDRYEIPLGTHAHGNWAFTREGVYRVTFSHSATLASGTRVSDTEVVTFAVGAAGPPATTQPTGTGCGPGAISTTALGRTGFELGTPLVLGGLLVVLGGTAAVVARRRKSTMDGEL